MTKRQRGLDSYDHGSRLPTFTHQPLTNLETYVDTNLAPCRSDIKPPRGKLPSLDIIFTSQVKMLKSLAASLALASVSFAAEIVFDWSIGWVSAAPDGVSRQLDAPGSYWYHSHNGGQYPDGLRGPLIVHDPEDPYAGQYDEEVLLTTSDWYHSQVPDLITQLLSTSNTKFLPPIPDAILLNDTNQGKFHFTPGKTYKIRFIGMAAFASTFFNLQGHTMTVIEVDGTYVEKQETDFIRVAPAQRYTVLVTALPTAEKNYAFIAALDVNRDFAHDPTPVFPLNITGYIIYDESQAYPLPYTVDQFLPVEDLSLASLETPALLPPPTRPIQLDFTFGFDAQGIPRTFFNNITYVEQKVPSLFTAFSTGTDNDNPTIYGTVNPFVAHRGDIVQIVINNGDAGIHPFHLHGHQFQIVAKGESNSGPFNGDGSNFPANPVRRDTVAVNANSYAVLRFSADNPGVWLFHCHIEWHVIMGLMATIIEIPEELRGLAIPADHQAVCDVQSIPTAGNAAGNTNNFLDMTGANITPKVPDQGATFQSGCATTKTCEKRATRRSQRNRISQRVPVGHNEYAETF
ncbi:hypothetical protein G7Y89_g1222 [Cudoniella acicularis]|uniref:Laccase n=1 Tax=Cudoniella acicularis TaxID=354080 RepID=A0A8H4WAH6_9HELO|nr:hypothetical protein G7Y89_g1222 [Cudoniella acicularis]